MYITAIGLGSNLGNRLLNLRTALRFLMEMLPCSGGNRLIKASDVFETEPWGVKNQPYFLNACLIMKNLLPLKDLLARIKGIESEMGRMVTRRWGERKIDIDILFMDSIVYDSPDLRIPHAEMHRRDFVLIPLAQIAPHWVHPRTKRAISEMASDFRDQNPTRICNL
ncbi:MAG: 2-amino-4-hydroxy-6-hydroxymethyldihydropteridine diphosphokinase [Synergistaceae bacterium]|nr:2-amino-4-hydroxy-6-hydroxymethyldihydropteridine diphosphokinase [Synergistaceae bacterium]